jgi:hypothetical protein
MTSILAQFYLLLLVAVYMAMLMVGINADAEPNAARNRNTIFQGPGRDTGYLNYSFKNVVYTFN